MEFCPEMVGLECELGTIKSAEQLCPGVYFLSAEKDSQLLSSDYYAVLENSVISQKAKSYGQKLSGIWLFPLDNDDESHKIIAYEIAKYRTKNHLPLDEPLRAAAFFAAQSFPEYFGVFPVPLNTPRGCTIRHWVMDNGIYWIETDQCEEFLAVSYPLWSCELSDLAEKLGEKTVHDRLHGIDKTLGYIFFPEQTSCIPVYELMRTRPGWEGEIIDKCALMNVIWKTIPEYAFLWNQQEQAGEHDFVSSLLYDLGIELEPNVSPKNIISICPDAGEKFLILGGKQ